MWSRAVIIRIEDNEVSVYTPCLHTLVLVFHADILPRHHPYVGHLKSMYCSIICCPAGSRGIIQACSCGGMAAGWKPGGRSIQEKSSFLSDNATASSSEDKFATAGCREVTCMRRAYANSLQIGIVSVIHPFRPFFNTWGGGFPNTIRVISSGLKDAKGRRSSSRVSPWNLGLNCSRTPFVTGQ